MGKQFISVNKDFDATAFPAASIFLKLEKMNPELPHRIIDEALSAQRKRYINPELRTEYAELEKEFASRKKSLQDIIKSAAEKIGLSFLFKTKAEPQPFHAEIPTKPARTIEQNRIFKPDVFSINKDRENRFDIDQTLLGSDLREAILVFLTEHQREQELALTPEEKQSLEPQI